MGHSDSEFVYNSREAAEAYAAKKGYKIVEEHLDHLVVKTRRPVRALVMWFYPTERAE